MNKFIYFHSLQDAPVRQALMNMAYDIGMLPVNEKAYENYGIIQITEIAGEHRFVIMDFKKDRESLTKFIHSSKAKEMILFTYLPIGTDPRVYPILQLMSDQFGSTYSIIGNVNIPSNETDFVRNALDAAFIDLQHQLQPIAQKEVLLADIAFAENGDKRHLLTRDDEHDFLVMKYDPVENETQPELQKILIGSNNDYLRVGNTGKYFWATCTFPNPRGRKEKREGRIMGGNCLQLDYTGRTPTFEILSQGFSKPKDMRIIEEYEIVDEKILNLDFPADASKIMKWDKELSVFTGSIQQTSNRRRMTVDDYIDKEFPKTTPPISRHDEYGGYSGALEKNGVDEETLKVITLKIA